MDGPYVDDGSNIFPEAILGRAKEDKVVDILDRGITNWAKAGGELGWEKSVEVFSCRNSVQGQFPPYNPMFVVYGNFPKVCVEGLLTGDRDAGKKRGRTGCV